jgi:hypothetical protein
MQGTGGMRLKDFRNCDYVVLLCNEMTCRHGGIAPCSSGTPKEI